MPQSAKITTRMRHKLEALAYSSSLYRLMISGPVPKTLLCTPNDSWPGDGERGKALLEGFFVCSGGRFQASPPDWLPDNPSPAFMNYVHGFVWLRDLRTLGGDSARRVARGLLSSWLDHFESWAPLVWEAPLIGDRLTRCVGLHDFALSSADGAFRARVFEQMVRESRHLMRIVPEALAGLLRVEEDGVTPYGQPALQGVELLRTLRGLVFAGVALPDSEKALALALSILPTCLRAALLGDGSVRERNPSLQAVALQCLIDMRQALREAQVALPPELPVAIEKAAAALRFFRYGDGHLALFNGGGESNAVMIEALLTLSDARARAPRSCGGYERVHAGRLLLVMDMAGPPPKGLDNGAHAGISSFELSAGRERIIVNCGAHPSEGGDENWREALAATAAHSTLTVGDKNSSVVLSDNGFGRRAAVLASARNSAGGLTSLEIMHDGYATTHGIIHTRCIALEEEGERMEGLERLEGRGGVTYALRFHLHPSVQASLTQSGTAVLIRAGTGFYRLTADGLPLTLEEGLYYGKSTPRRSVQIVLRAETREGENNITWQFVREKKN
jgi:uncharacterized heparinase superfamily protein